MNKKTPTVKKYEKLIGKLYWTARSIYDPDVENYRRDYNLVMVTGLKRWGKGAWLYTCTTLHSCDPDVEPHDISYRCSQFESTRLLAAVPADGSKPRYTGMLYEEAKNEERADRKKMQEAKNSG